MQIVNKVSDSGEFGSFQTVGGQRVSSGGRCADLLRREVLAVGRTLIERERSDASFNLTRSNADQ